MNFEQLIHKIENAKPIDFGNVISKSFELYKTYFQQGLVHTLITMAVVIPFLIVVYWPLLPGYIDAIQHAGDPYYQPNFFENFSEVMIIGWVFIVFVLSFLVQLLAMSISGHFYLVLRKEDAGVNEAIGGYFELLKTHFGKLLLLTLATTGIALVAALLCYLPIFYVIVPLHWVFPLFVFNPKLSVSEVIKAAFKFANKNWLVFAGLGIICSIMASLGMILCYIGVIFTSFYIYIATYVTYRDSIGFDDEDDISQIGDRLDTLK